MTPSDPSRSQPTGSDSRFAPSLRTIHPDERRRFLAEGMWTTDPLGHRLATRLSEHKSTDFVIHSATRPWRGTFGDVLDLSLHVAAGLRRLGVGPGDVVSFQTPNWIEGAATFYGASLLGAVVAPVVHIYGPKELSYILGVCQPRVHVTASQFGRQDYLENLAGLGDATDLAGTEVIVVDGPKPSGTTAFSTLVDGPALDELPTIDPSAPAVIGWTSGTTANPKGVVHSHETALAEVKQLGDTRSPGTRPSLMANPISHAIGMLGSLLIPVDRNNAVHLLDLWDPATVLELMLSEDLSASGGATYFIASLLEHPNFTDEHLAHLPYQGMGGAPIPRAFAERLTALGINVHRMYGSTEHPSVTGCTYADPLDKRLATDGVPLPGNQIRLVDAGGREVEPGEPGEIYSRGPELFLGYTDPELTAKVFDSDGWYHTGDIAVADQDGYICITDRLSDVIIRGGENISAAEVEELLAAGDGVAEVAVVAAPDERFGEHAVAYVRTLPSHDDAGQATIDLATVRAQLEAAGLARQKWPEEVFVMEDFPRTSSGKIQKFVLRQQLRDPG